MKHALIFGLLLLLCSFVCSADSFGQSFGPYSITATGCTKPIQISGYATATYYVEGSWSGTIQPQVSVAAQAPVNALATPAASTSTQGTVTASGAYFSSVSGYTFFVACGNSVTGTATLYINISTAPH